MSGVFWLQQRYCSLKYIALSGSSGFIHILPNCATVALSPWFTLSPTTNMGLKGLQTPVRIRSPFL